MQSIGQLLVKGETRLIVAVETGRIPLNVALEIAEIDLDGAQEALAKACETGLAAKRTQSRPKNGRPFRQNSMRLTLRYVKHSGKM